MASDIFCKFENPVRAQAGSLGAARGKPSCKTEGEYCKLRRCLKLSGRRWMWLGQLESLVFMFASQNVGNYNDSKAREKAYRAMPRMSVPVNAPVSV